MLVNLPHRHLPAFHGVTLFTICPELALVDISVAVRALLADIREDWLHVTLGASDILVHTAQRKSGLTMVEFRLVANWFPAIQRVAVLAGYVEWAMGATRTRGPIGRRSHGRCDQNA